MRLFVPLEINTNLHDTGFMNNTTFLHKKDFFLCMN